MANQETPKYYLKFKCVNCGFEDSAKNFKISGRFWKKVSCPQCQKAKLAITLNGQDVPELNKIPNVGLYYLVKRFQKNPNSDEFKI
ncbi:MAG: hypothetical protein NTX82_05785 [Candidatus Parcubacteria bacterium]|nr:hypothetical protein [Candidatus Parcubacteria bacterium]